MHYYFFFAVDGSLRNLDSAMSIGKKISGKSIASVPEPLLDAARVGTA